MKKVELWQTVFKIWDYKIKVCKVIGVYDLKKVKQDKEGYLFNTPFQLVAACIEGDQKLNIASKIYNGPIEKYMFERLDDFYLTLEEAETALEKKRKKSRDKMERDLKEEIKELKKEIRLKEEAIQNIKH